MRTTIAPETGRVGLRRVIVTLLATLTALAGMAIPATIAAAPAHAGSSRAMPADFDTQVIYWTNVERKKRGLRPLVAHSCVDRFGSRHTNRLAVGDRFYHQALRPVLRQCKMRTAGENLAYRSPSLSPREVVTMWMKSPGHRSNLLAKKYRFIGVDAYQSSKTGRIYAGQVFGG